MRRSLRFAGASSDTTRLHDPRLRLSGHAVARDQIKRGDLVFWKGHMGVMRDAETLLHANAFHMQVTSELLEAVIARIAAPVTSIKRL